MQENFTCKNCGSQHTGRFCNYCGEKVYAEKDKSVSHLLSEGFHFITHFEGTFFNTLTVLFTRPGKFSDDYCNGIRKKYFKPISFFLLLVILYLLFPFFDGLNMKLYQYTGNTWYKNYALHKAIKIMQVKDLTDAQLAEAFQHASEKTSKILLFIIIPVMALFSWMLGFRKRKYYYDNFVFSIEASSFFILWGFLLLPLLLQILSSLFPVVAEMSDLQRLFLILGLFLTFLIIAVRRFFKFKWWYSILYSFVFTFILAIFIQFIYKFILFFITIHLV